MDYLEIKNEIDQNLKRLYVRPGVLADPQTLATLLVIVGTHKVTLAELATDLQHLADSRKAEVYYQILSNSNVSRAKEECRMDKTYMLAKRNAEFVTAYLKEVSSLVSTVQTYLKWKGQETSL